MLAEGGGEVVKRFRGTLNGLRGTPRGTQILRSSYVVLYQGSYVELVCK